MAKEANSVAAKAKAAAKSWRKHGMAAWRHQQQHATVCYLAARKHQQT